MSGEEAGVLPVVILTVNVEPWTILIITLSFNYKNMQNIYVHEPSCQRAMTVLNFLELLRWIRVVCVGLVRVFLIVLWDFSVLLFLHVLFSIPDVAYCSSIGKRNTHSTDSSLRSFCSFVNLIVFLFVCERMWTLCKECFCDCVVGEELMSGCEVECDSASLQGKSTHQAQIHKTFIRQDSFRSLWHDSYRTAFAS